MDERLDVQDAGVGWRMQGRIREGNTEVGMDLDGGWVGFVAGELG